MKCFISPVIACAISAAALLGLCGSVDAASPTVNYNHTVNTQHYHVRTYNHQIYYHQVNTQTRNLGIYHHQVHQNMINAQRHY
jgi:hypothetical protein